jgi:hypothetical protein
VISSRNQPDGLKSKEIKQKKRTRSSLKRSTLKADLREEIKS